VGFICSICTGGCHGGGGGDDGGRVHRQINYERTVKMEEDAASVCGYAGTLGANSQGEEFVRVHRYTMSKQSGRRPYPDEQCADLRDGQRGEVARAVDGHDGVVRLDARLVPGAYTRPLFSST
jgi:hypothetical protein